MTHPPHRTTGVVGALNAEWARLCASAASREAVRGWARTCSDATGAWDLRDVEARAADPGTADATLGMLVRLGQGGDQLAARTAMQLMLGAALRIAGRTLHHARFDRDEAEARAIAALWQVIQGYPLDRRSCRHADGIALDVLALLTDNGRPRLREECLGEALATVVEGTVVERGSHEASYDVSDVRSRFLAAARLPSGSGCADEQLIVVLGWAVREGVVSREEAALLFALHSPADPERPRSAKELAPEFGTTHDALRQRTSRATRRLAVAVQSFATASHGEPGAAVA